MYSGRCPSRLYLPVSSHTLAPQQTSCWQSYVVPSQGRQCPGKNLTVHWLSTHQFLFVVEPFNVKNKVIICRCLRLSCSRHSVALCCFRRKFRQRWRHDTAGMLRRRPRQRRWTENVKQTQSRQRTSQLQLPPLLPSLPTEMPRLQVEVENRDCLPPRRRPVTSRMSTAMTRSTACVGHRTTSPSQWLPCWAFCLVYFRYLV